VHMELCRLMRAVILALKNCTRKIVQQNDNNLKSDDTFFIRGWNVKGSSPKSQSLLPLEYLAFSSYNRSMVTNL
jgi:hypothetical protein